MILDRNNIISNKPSIDYWANDTLGDKLSTSSGIITQW
jgi:hypothetical protein